MTVYVLDAEEGDTSDFDSVTTAGSGVFEASTSQKFEGAYSFRSATPGGAGDTAYGVLTTSLPSADMTAVTLDAWYYHKKTMADGDLYVGQAYRDDTVVCFTIRMQRSGANRQIMARCKKDDTTNLDTDWITISDQTWISFQVRWKAATGAGQDDGELVLLVEGTTKTISNIDNDTHALDNIRVGASSAVDAGTTAADYWDNLRFIDAYNPGFERTVAGSLTNTGALAKSTLTLRAGSLTSTGALAKSTLKVVAGSITKTGALVRLIRKVVGGTITKIGILKPQFVRRIFMIIDTVITAGKILIKSPTNEED